MVVLTITKWMLTKRVYTRNGKNAFRRVPTAFSPNASAYHFLYLTERGKRLANVQNANAFKAALFVATARPSHSMNSPK